MNCGVSYVWPRFSVQWFPCRNPDLCPQWQRSRGRSHTIRSDVPNGLQGVFQGWAQIRKRDPHSGAGSRGERSGGNVVLSESLLQLTFLEILFCRNKMRFLPSWASRTGVIKYVSDGGIESPRSRQLAAVLRFYFQVVENVRVFVTDANDQPPEFQNLPFIVNIAEVRLYWNNDKCFFFFFLFGVVVMDVITSSRWEDVDPLLKGIDQTSASKQLPSLCIFFLNAKRLPFFLLHHSLCSDDLEAFVS